MKVRPTVYLLCAFIGAQKTTLARELETRTGAIRITKDEWLIHLIGKDPTIDGYGDYDQKVVELSRKVAFQLVDKGSDVIVDEGFSTREERTLMRKVERMGADVVLYSLNAPIDTIWERVARRSVDPQRTRFGSAEHYWTPTCPSGKAPVKSNAASWRLRPK